MNLFYKYSHLQRFEQQNEKDGRKEKGQMTKQKGEMGNDKGERRKDKGQMTKEKWRWEKEKERKRKDFPPGIPQQKVSLLLFRF